MAANIRTEDFTVSFIYKGTEVLADIASAVDLWFWDKDSDIRYDSDIHVSDYDEEDPEDEEEDDDEDIVDEAQTLQLALPASTSTVRDLLQFQGLLNNGEDDLEVRIRYFDSEKTLAFTHSFLCDFFSLSNHEGGTKNDNTDLKLSITLGIVDVAQFVVA